MALRHLQRRLATGTNAVLVVVLVLVALGLLVEIAGRRPVRIDLSASGQASLAPETTAALQLLVDREATLEVIAFGSQRRDGEGAVRNQLLGDFLAQLERASDRVDARLLDLDRDRLEAERLGVDRYGTVVLRAAGDRVDLEERRLFRATGPRGEREVSFVGEGAFAAGIRRLLSDRSRVVYWLGGHGERERFDRGLGELHALSALLDDQGFTVRDLDLLRDADGVPSVPEDAAAVWIVGPSAPLADAEDEALDTWLRTGGAVAVFVDVGDATPDLLGELGVAAPAGVVRDAAIYPPHEDRPVLRYVAHPITEAAADAGLATMLASPAPLQVTPRPGVEARPLLRTGRSGWLERGEERPSTFDEGVDQAGPVETAYGITVSRPHRWAGSRVVVVGDTDWVADDLLGGAPGNATLLASLARWLVDDAERATVVGRPRAVRRVAITASSLDAVRVWTIVVVPLLVLGVGFLVRRQRRAS